MPLRSIQLGEWEFVSGHLACLHCSFPKRSCTSCIRIALASTAHFILWCYEGKHIVNAPFHRSMHFCRYPLLEVGHVPWKHWSEQSGSLSWWLWLHQRDCTSSRQCHQHLWRPIPNCQLQICELQDPLILACRPFCSSQIFLEFAYNQRTSFGLNLTYILCEIYSSRASS